ncbi:linoleate 13S-lipoxygenase 2-1, chloroplastic-like [Vigna unguiculata]|uniref:linoleate 13S-lipoxygenase 2-1, chloroplastic-like n=1 Tax=Vigna unguiculata TaxID=3917 RepID=UPI001015D919|nr:linoleate 13S-lipoxygenase 2-1, chloroplastic-like [Vigna unguiculata]
MQMQQVHASNSSYLISHRPSLRGIPQPSFQLWSRPSSFPTQRKLKRVSHGCRNDVTKIKAVAVNKTEKSVKVKATISVQPTIGGIFSSLAIDADDLTDLLGKSLFVELLSAELDPKTKLEKKPIQDFAHRTHRSPKEVRYLAEFDVPVDFGEIGAILVENEHRREMFIKEIILDGFELGPVRFTCESWLHPKKDNPVKRVFFPDKSYLPSETPEGVKRVREEELQHLRGNGQGERKKFDRIYDYDVYNDLGDPDKDPDLQRPVLGGAEHPYPRRCRTGRPRSAKDSLSEERTSDVYVPRDECFSEVKQLTFNSKTLASALQALVPALTALIVDKNLPFQVFSEIDALYDEGVPLPAGQGKVKLSTLLPRLVSLIKDRGEDILRFEIPATMDKDRFFWLRDEEFGRQTLAGLNPCCIQLVTEWPLKSNLDPAIYGPAESAITTELVEQEIRGFLTVEEAIKQKRLFVLDYHDLLLPLVEEVRKIEGTTLYGSRALFFLTRDGTLRPLAIELVRPPIDGKPQWKKVFAPTWHSTGVWLWRLAKIHVLAHDTGYHQLVSHWLRTHCATEPYIIAANRQLSAMHPIYRLLHPHFRYTMEINALARESLINAGGIIEQCFTPQKHSVLLSSIAYDKHWRFDLQSLPKDLIHRGLAVEDPTAPHGLKLTIEDYPYANDGLDLWAAFKSWFTEYIDHYYADSNAVQSDTELQAWWDEVINVGHADKKDEPWWPALKTKEDLVEVVTTIAWTTSGHHAAVNFGQFSFAGYFPNRPTIARTNLPLEDPSDPEWELFLQKPEVTMLKCFPSQYQATTVITVLDVLSNHSPDEEYIGTSVEPAWEQEPRVKAAFEKFKGRLNELEGTIDERNADLTKKNRNGAGVVPYELLKPTSEAGVTGKGVPYSISI